MAFSPIPSLSLQQTRRHAPVRMARAALRVLGALLIVTTHVVSVSAATAKEAYESALAREQAARAALEADDAGNTAAGEEARAVVAAYRRIVRVYPTSPYSDNALWQAGRLSIDLFQRFGNDADRTLGLRLLRTLRSEYPSSSLIKEIPAQLARVSEERARQAAASVPEATHNDAPGDAAAKRPTSAVASRTVTTSRSQPGTIATIKGIRREVLADAVRVTIELDAEVPYSDERIPNPLRVFVDLPSTRLASNLVERTIRYDGDGDIVRQIRIGRHPNNVTRVVLEADGVATYSVYPLYNPYRLVIDSFTTAPPASSSDVRGFTAPPAVVPAVAVDAALPADNAVVPAVRLDPEVTRPETMRPEPIPASKPKIVAVVPALMPLPSPAASPAPEPTHAEIPSAELPRSETPAPAPVAAAPPPPTPPARNSGGGYSMARQLGLGVSRIVIDPGHGGQDPGAKGKSLDESELVLDIALRVEKLLEKTEGVEVILTRRTDEYIPLQERTAIANREGADLFLSIHANASPNASASGIETYYLNFATNMSAASVAARENAASGHSMGSLPDFLKQIALNNKIDESRDFATAVQKSMVERLRKSNKTVKDLGVKQAPFVVLIGAAMPSVLAEISFVTNTQEARLLRGSAYRQRIAEALVSAIGTYQSGLKSAPKVAQQ